MNPTMRKFGWPGSAIKEFEHWALLARPTQPTLGSLVLAAKSDATAFSALPSAAHAELAVVTAAIEAALRRAVRYDQINYLMLMMTDRQVHFHVLPRYDGDRTWDGLTFADAGWPNVPDLSSTVTLEATRLDAFVRWIGRYFD